jgi:hypothetical protein
MKVNYNDPPRKCKVGVKKTITLKDCAHIILESDEQVSFETDKGAEYDVCKKKWGFYATPSLNGRLKTFRLRSVLVVNQIETYYIMLVEKNHESEFYRYLVEEKLKVVCWLDISNNLKIIRERLGKE